MENDNLKEKYAQYYRQGKGNINHFINGIRKNNEFELQTMYDEVCKEEKDIVDDLELDKHKLQKASKCQIEDIKFNMDWNEKKLEFVRIKKDVLQRELKELKQEER